MGPVNKDQAFRPYLGINIQVSAVLKTGARRQFTKDRVYLRSGLGYGAARGCATINRPYPLYIVIVVGASGIITQLS